VLEQHRRASNPLNVLVFATSRGAMPAPSNIRRRWHSPTLKGAKLPHIRLQDLRHTAATLAIAGGDSILFVQAQLGHTSVRTTQRYAHPDRQAHREAARAEAWRSGDQGGGR
jgi:integrase